MSTIAARVAAAGGGILVGHGFQVLSVVAVSCTAPLPYPLTRVGCAALASADSDPMEAAKNTFADHTDSAKQQWTQVWIVRGESDVVKIELANGEPVGVLDEAKANPKKNGISTDTIINLRVATWAPIAESTAVIAFYPANHVPAFVSSRTLNSNGGNGNSSTSTTTATAATSNTAENVDPVLVAEEGVAPEAKAAVVATQKRDDKRGAKDDHAGSGGAPQTNLVFAELMSFASTDVIEAAAPHLSLGANPAPHRFLLDIVAYPQPGDSFQKMRTVLLQSLREQREYAHKLFPAAESVHFFHFQSKNFFSHIISLPYPAGKTDKDLMAERKTFHETLLLPLDRPLLRISSAIAIESLGAAGSSSASGSGSGSGGRSVHLRNVHEGLPPSKVKDGKLYLTYGEYEYYHYMQDAFDDNGWGCAYRSLQTICSWLKLQGYTGREPPTHREIQETLVKCKDKEAKFIGSKQWIGSIECSLCLDSLYDVTSKIIFVNSGAELAEKGRELARHFTTQGTPIMVGGGVLAYTLLGIDYNEDTGDIAFLILDPHYPNANNDDMKTIHKNWCKWHPVSIFRADSFYNLCCPQRPNLY